MSAQEHTFTFSNLNTPYVDEKCFFKVRYTCQLSLLNLIVARGCVNIPNLVYKSLDVVFLHLQYVLIEITLGML